MRVINLHGAGSTGFAYDPVITSPDRDGGHQGVIMAAAIAVATVVVIETLKAIPI